MGSGMGQGLRGYIASAARRELGTGALPEFCTLVHCNQVGRGRFREVRGHASCIPSSGLVDRRSTTPHSVTMQEYGLGGTALNEAVRDGKNVELVQLLLERGADVDAKDKVRLLMWRGT